MGEVPRARNTAQNTLTTWHADRLYGTILIATHMKSKTHGYVSLAMQNFVPSSHYTYPSVTSEMERRWRRIRSDDIVRDFASVPMEARTAGNQGSVEPRVRELYDRVSRVREQERNWEENWGDINVTTSTVDWGVLNVDGGHIEIVNATAQLLFLCKVSHMKDSKGNLDR
eukprot:scaffold1328_cov83-Skeletonema_marinoi.AAC.1